MEAGPPVVSETGPRLTRGRRGRRLVVFRSGGTKDLSFKESTLSLLLAEPIILHYLIRKMIAIRIYYILTVVMHAFYQVIPSRKKARI